MAAGTDGRTDGVDGGADEAEAVPLFDESIAAMRATIRKARPKPPAEAAVGLPYAQVVVDLDLSHLDHPFDYLVPAPLDEAAQPGVRIRCRFAGQDVDGFVLGRSAESVFAGRFDWVKTVVSPEPVLTPETAALARTVADRYAGTLSDVLRLAVPPRHAAAEKKPRPAPPDDPQRPVDASPWTLYPDGEAFVAALGDAARTPRAVWTCAPGMDWAVALATALHATALGGRGALAVVPDKRDLARLDKAVKAVAGHGRHVILAEDLGPSKRYQNWLAVLRGDVRIAIGTRAAMFAPVRDLGLVAIWDDGDDLHADQHAPYPHVREVLTLRAHRTGAAALIGGYACTAEGAQLIASGWARPLTAHRDTIRAKAPLIRTSGEELEQVRDPAAAAARLPNLAWRTARAALAHGPVLIQVPRGGYAPALACVRCRKHARCEHCHGPLALTSGHAIAQCGWCGRPAGGWHCTGTVEDRPCGAQRFRLTIVGVQRTAEELGRAFPGIPVMSSAQDTIIAEIGPKPALVLATPGAEPVAEGGYRAALLLDGWALLGRRDLRANEEALRRWLNAAALVRPAAEHGVVVVMADPTQPPVQALLRWDPVWHAERELHDRSDLHYPPIARVAELTGTPAAVAEALALLRLPDGAEVLGPVVVDPPWPAPGSGHGHGQGLELGKVTDETHRALVRVPRRAGADLAAAVREAQGVRSARKVDDWVRVRMDPMQIG